MAVGFVMGSKSGGSSLASMRSTVSGLAASGDVTKALNGVMAGAVPMAGQLLKTGRQALEGLRH